MSDVVSALNVEREPAVRRGQADELLPGVTLAGTTLADALGLAAATALRRPCPALAADGGKEVRGQGLVELALALPVLLLIMLGTLDLGRVFFDYIQLRGAVQEGAAYGARHPTDDAGIVARVRDHGIPPGTVVLPPACAPGLAACTTPGATAKIVVAAQRTFTPVTTAFLQNYFGIEPWTITVSATMRVMT